MKVSKLVSIDYELVQRLKQEDNASAIINSLLMAHYNSLKSEEEIIADVKAKINEKKEEINKEKRIIEGVKKRIKEVKALKIKPNFGNAK